MSDADDEDLEKKPVNRFAAALGEESIPVAGASIYQLRQQIVRYEDEIKRLKEQIALLEKAKKT